MKHTLIVLILALFSFAFSTSAVAQITCDNASHFHKAKADFDNASSSGELLDAFMQLERYRHNLSSSEYEQLDQQQIKCHDDIQESYSKLLSTFKERSTALEKKESEKTVKETSQGKEIQNEQEQQSAELISQNAAVQQAIKYLDSGSGSPMPIKQDVILNYLQIRQNKSSSYSRAELEDATFLTEQKKVVNTSLVKPLEDMGYSFDDTVKYAALKLLTKDYKTQEFISLSSLSIHPMQIRETLFSFGFISENTYDLLNLLYESQNYIY